MYDHNMFRHIAANRDKHLVHALHTHVDTRQKLCIRRLRALLCYPSFPIFGDLLSLELLFPMGPPLSMLSEGSQPYVCYKNSAYVSESGMSETQPTRVYTLQTPARIEFSRQERWEP